MPSWSCSVIAVLTATAVLVSAHLAVRRETAPLPSLEAIDAVATVGAIVDDAPVRIAVVNTASQTHAARQCARRRPVTPTAIVRM